MRDQENLEFVWALVQLSNRQKWERDEVIYAQGDIAETFFFIYRGTVKMYGKSGKTVIKYGRGDTIGESDGLLGEERDCKATAKEPCVLYEIKCKDLEKLYERF